MKRLKQILVTTFVVTVLAVLLTGCGETVESIEQESEVVKACTDSGGEPRLGLFGGVECDLID